MANSSKNLKKVLGEGIAAIRRHRGWTQEDFAHHSGIPDSTIQKIESGARWPGDKTLSKILEALHAEVNEIFHSTTPVSGETLVEIAKLRGALELVETSVDSRKLKEMQRRLTQAEPQARAYTALEKHLGHDLLERLKHTTKEDLELLKATLPEVIDGVKKLQGS